jgi:DUF1365 family protein
MTFQSAIYVGSVMHHRLRPRNHQFKYRAFWLLLDLDELDTLSAKLSWFSRNRLNLFSFYDADHGDGGATQLRTQIANRLDGMGLHLKGGRIKLLCMPRMLGHCFNPISVFFCYRADGTLAALIYEVHNTFGERHSYIVPAESDAGALRQSTCKSFYVSPFMAMDMRYDFRIAAPDERVKVGIRASDDCGAVLHAVLSGARQPLTDRSLVRLFILCPAVTLKVVGAIHWEALKLWFKGVPFQPRRVTKQPAATASFAAD